MACPCQTAVLKTFVRTIAQVHASHSVTLRTLSSRHTLAIARITTRPAIAFNSASPIPATRSAKQLYSTAAQDREAQVGTSSDGPSEPPRLSTPVAQHTGEPEATAANQGAKDEAQEHDTPSATDATAKPVKKLKLKKKAQQAKLATEAAEAGISLSQLKRKTKAPAEKTKPKARPTAKGRASQAPASAGTKKQKSERAVLEATEDAEEDLAAKEEQPGWGVQKSALQAKFPDGWSPPKKLSPDALAGIRALHQRFPEDYSTEVLAAKFEVSPEAIRRILKSSWQPSAGEEEDRQRRWFERGKRVWARWAELGKKPPRQWRREGIVRSPYWHTHMTRSGRPRTAEEIEAVKFARAEKLKKKISQSLL